MGEVATEAGVEFPRKVVVEFGEEFDIEEEDGGGGEFVGDHVEEDFWAVVFGGLAGTLLGFEGQEAHLEDGGSVTEKDRFAAFEGRG